MATGCLSQPLKIDPLASRAKMKSIHIAVLILILTAMSALYVPSQANAQRKSDSTAEILKFEDGFSAALAHNDIVTQLTTVAEK
jgi:hypothetical protein